MSHTLNYILKVSQVLLFVSYLSSCNSIQNRKNFLSYKLPKPCALHVKSIYDFGRLPLLCDHIYVCKWFYCYSINIIIYNLTLMVHKESVLLDLILEVKKYFVLLCFITVTRISILMPNYK